MQQTKLLTLAVALCIPSFALGQLSWAGVTNSASLQSGEGTFYGLGSDSAGTCSYSQNFANTNGLAWSSGTDLTVAMNDAQFADGAACGMCIRLRGNGAGLGTTPIPSSWTNAFVNNRCPECAKGDVDLAASGDGRWNIQWYAVPCNVGSTPLQYSIVVSSYYWFSMVVSNTRVPVAGVSVKIGGSWLPLKRSANNQWPYYNTNGPWQSSFPMGVRVTSITGQTVEDVITSVSGNTGAVQFSSDGSSSTAASSVPATTTSTASPPVGATPTVNTPPVQAAVQSPPPVPTSPPVQTSPPAVFNQSPPAPLAVAGGFYAENYQQCGGNGGACNDKPFTSAPCADAAWKAATCRSSNFACVRASADLWTCVPGTSGTPPVAGTTPPSPPVSATPPVSAGTPPASTGTPPASTGTPPASVNTPPTPVSTPSGTSVGTPAGTTQGTPVSTPASPVAVSPPTPTATSAATSTETAGIQLSYAQATPAATSAATQAAAQTPPATPAATSASTASSQSQSSSSKSIAIAAGGQCGGTSSCDPAGQSTDKVNCNNGPWSGAYCPSGYSCTAAPGPLVWLCTQSSIASAGRRLLQ